MSDRRADSEPSDDQVRALLDHHKCPVPFHEVRTRFLGNIATPDPGVSPVRMVERLWGGKLPEFESLDQASELMTVLVMNLWNRLTRHQERSSPFRLTLLETDATRAGLAATALVRRQEIDGFIEGLFGPNESLNLPERVHRGFNELGAIRAHFAAVVELATDTTKPGTQSGMKTTARLIREMTKFAEHEIHAVVLSCARARRQLVESMPTKKPTKHRNSR